MKECVLRVANYRRQWRIAWQLHKSFLRRLGATYRRFERRGATQHQWKALDRLADIDPPNTYEALLTQCRQLRAIRRNDKAAIKAYF